MIKNFYLDKFYSNKIKILQKSINYFYNSISTNSSFNQLKIGCELEFFLLDQNRIAVDDFDIIENFCKLVNGKREQGVGQIEIITNYTDDLILLAQEIDFLKQKIINTAHDFELSACFDGKPFANDCGSALQFNISLHDSKSSNIFTMNQILIKHFTNSLLDLTNSMLAIICPNPEDYLRFDIKNNIDLFRNKKYTAPVNLCYGNDNRTCAVRICKSKDDSLAKRLEYRVPSANCDIWLGLSATVIALAYGLQNKSSSYQVIYGNAFDDKYLLPRIICRQDEALEKWFNNENFIYQKFQEFINK